MELLPALQEAVVALYAYDKDNKELAARLSVVPPAIFDSYYSEIWEEVRKYRERFGEAPDQHLLDLVDSLCAKYPKRESLYRRIFASVTQTYTGGINTSYVLDKVNEFFQYQHLKSTIAEAIDILGDERVGCVERTVATLSKALNFDTNNLEIGTYASDVTPELFYNETVSGFDTGIHAFDKYGVVPKRGTAFTLMGHAGRGKSWFLVHLMKVYSVVGLRVVYISLEMSAQDVLVRFYQSAFGISKSEGDSTLRKVLHDDEGELTGLSRYKITPKAVIDRESSEFASYVNDKARKLAKRNPPLIKDFPSGSLTMEQLNAYIDMLDAKGWSPDVVLLDYLDLMNVRASDDSRKELGRLFVECRGMARSRNLAFVTVAQCNRTGNSEQVLTRHNIAEDYSKIMTTDVFVTFNQTDQEKELGLGRLYVDKARGAERERFQVLVSQNLRTGQFCLSNAIMNSSYKLHTAADAAE